MKRIILCLALMGCAPTGLVAMRKKNKPTGAITKVEQKTSAEQTVLKPELIKAAQSGDIKAIAKALDAGLPIDAPSHQADSKGGTLLMLAVQNNQEELACFLIERGANVNSQEQFGFSPLFFSIQTGNLDLFSTLIEKGASITCPSYAALTPLMMAAAFGRSDMVTNLLFRKVGVNERDEAGNTALRIAAHKGHTDIVRFLIQCGANVEVGSQDGSTPLIAAAEKGHVAVVKVLLEFGANVQAQTKNGLTALLVSAAHNHDEVARLLIEARSDVNKSVSFLNYESPLSLFAMAGNLARVRQLINAGAVIDSRTSAQATPLILAASYGHFAIVKELIVAGANPCASNKTGLTALHCAIDGDRLSMVRFLLGLKRFSHHELKGYLQYAIRYGKIKSIPLLLSVPNFKVAIRDLANELKVVSQTSQNTASRIKKMIGSQVTGANARFLKAIQENNLSLIERELQNDESSYCFINLFDNEDGLHWNNPVHSALKNYEKLRNKVLAAELKCHALKDEKEKKELATEILTHKKELSTAKKIVGLLVSINPEKLSEENGLGISPLSCIFSDGIFNDVADIIKMLAAPDKKSEEKEEKHGATKQLDADVARSLAQEQGFTQDEILMIAQLADREKRAATERRQAIQTIRDSAHEEKKVIPKKHKKKQRQSSQKTGEKKQAQSTHKPSVISTVSTIAAQSSPSPANDVDRFTPVVDELTQQLQLFGQRLKDRALDGDLYVPGIRNNNGEKIALSYHARHRMLSLEDTKRLKRENPTWRCSNGQAIADGRGIAIADVLEALKNVGTQYDKRNETGQIVESSLLFVHGNLVVVTDLAKRIIKTVFKR